MSKSSMIFYVETGWRVHVTLLNLGTGSGTPSTPVKVNYTCPSTKLIKGYSLVRLKPFTLSLLKDLNLNVLAWTGAKQLTKLERIGFYTEYS